MVQTPVASLTGLYSLLLMGGFAEDWAVATLTLSNSA